jgi:hypothetical protein
LSRVPSASTAMPSPRTCDSTARTRARFTIAEQWIRRNLRGSRRCSRRTWTATPRGRGSALWRLTHSREARPRAWRSEAMDGLRHRRSLQSGASRSLMPRSCRDRDERGRRGAVRSRRGAMRPRKWSWTKCTEWRWRADRFGLRLHPGAATCHESERPPDDHPCTESMSP